MLSGYKTYLVAGFLLVAVVIEKGLGIDVPGLEVADNWLPLVLNALGLGTLRGGVGAVMKTIVANAK